jgi:hypothetical protein
MPAVQTAHVGLDQRGQGAAIGAGFHGGKINSLGFLIDSCLKIGSFAKETKKVPKRCQFQGGNLFTGGGHSRTPARFRERAFQACAFEEGPAQTVPANAKKSAAPRAELKQGMLREMADYLESDCR